MKAAVLLAEDDAIIREGMATALRQDEFDVRAVPNGTEALRSFLDSPPDVVVADIKMPGMNGIELLERIRAADPEAIFILMTAYGSINSAVEAMRKGAYDYLTKPMDLDRLTLLIRKALNTRDLRRENVELHRQLGERFALRNIIGTTPSMLRLLTAVEQVAATEASVLIRGESGTGKELIAQALHHSGSRAKGAFVAFNCAALPENLMEDELFGHERGSFTGADRRRIGRFESADRGTLFLDEIGDVTLPVQAKLLRVLEERSFQRVGGGETVRVDVRLIAATNKDLERLVKDGAFREDLYYRIKVVTVQVPALRERPEDIPLLVTHFLHECGQRHGKKVGGVTRTVMRILTTYPWPGNVRELRNCVEEMVVLATDEMLTEKDLPSAFSNFDLSRQTFSVQAGTPLSEIERRVILHTLQLVSGNKRKAAEMLGIGIATLYRKIQEYRIHQ
ncbi:MAG TPA: sigma-54 dependent transcriptional regulator [Syntrophobacteria bacterium]|nr:sigma-54 dependent transcriptional regulator [archaeon]HYA03054.1 sigma-54 dependent transcriptional regulator [Syntrophobacteria bacterium]